MSGLAVELELDRLAGVAAHQVRCVHNTGVVADAGVDTVEDPAPDHPYLAAQHLLRGAAEELDCTLDALPLHGVPDRQGPTEARGPVDVVSTSVARSPLLYRLLIGHRLL